MWRHLIELTFNRVTGRRLRLRQLWVLLLRQLYFVKSKKITFLLIQVILPILCLCFLIQMNNVNHEVDHNADNPKVPMDLNIYTHMYKPSLLYKFDSDEYSLGNIPNRNPKVKFTAAEDDINSVLRTRIVDNGYEYIKHLMGIEIKSTDVKVFYTTLYRHTAPVALNLLTNVLAAHMLGDKDGPIITTYNHPIRKSQEHSSQNQSTPSNLKFYAIAFLIVAVVANAVTLPCQERVNHTRHIHVMAGCTLELYWFATLLFHTVLYTIILIIPIIIVTAALEPVVKESNALGLLFLVMMIGVVAYLSMVYFISTLFADRAANITLIVIAILSFISTLMKYGEEYMRWCKVISTIFYYLAPPHTLAVALTICQRTEVSHDAVTVCKSTSSEISVLFVQMIVYLALTLLMEYGIFNALFDKLFNYSYTVKTNILDDVTVRAEAEHVENEILLPKQEINDLMLASELHKNYWTIFGKACNAVKGISFSVKKGECFGLLGVNGAGKSTTFKMLTAEECATRGRIFANKTFLTPASRKYLHSLAYCPQFFGLDMFLTGQQNLELLLTLRGLSADNVKSQVDTWIGIIGLERYKDRVVSAYSGGCARRLSCVCALACGVPLTLLDEPTAGVDPAARRRVWTALRRALASRRALLITSHSMDEMEALCSRIAIMSHGKIVALGSASALRASHGSGHVLQLKLNVDHSKDVTDGSSKVELDVLKADLRQRFVCTLKDEHETMLYYHIDETMSYSELFSRLEDLKAKHPNLVEDYSINETTLEEVFLSLAKDASPSVATINHV